ncbi:triose-phosphate isomerase [bacterium]|nr:triose-phosphate isomerase [bacterium]
MRKIIVAGNWKMNHNYDQAKGFVEDLLPQLKEVKSDRVEIMIAPTFVFVQNLIELAEGSQLQIGAQDVSSHEIGAFTGEVSAQMLASINANFVIIGHSERREYHHESDRLIKEKLIKLLDHKIRPIVCIGETLDQREDAITQDVILTQLKGCFAGIDLADNPQVVIAYEPVWAIGTGKTATPEMAEEVHAMIRDWLTSEYGSETAEAIHILYGGSMKADNIEALVSQPNIDGGLIGGASLKVVSYLEMIKIASKI